MGSDGKPCPKEPKPLHSTTFSAWWHMPLKKTLANDSWKISLMGKISYYIPCIAGLEPRFQVRGDEGRLTLFEQARDFIWDMLGYVFIYIYCIYIYISPIRQIFNIWNRWYLPHTLALHFVGCFPQQICPLAGSELGLEDVRCLSLVGWFWMFLFPSGYGSEAW